MHGSQLQDRANQEEKQSNSSLKIDVEEVVTPRADGIASGGGGHMSSRRRMSLRIAKATQE
jgi:hypothetical protein